MILGSPPLEIRRHLVLVADAEAGRRAERPLVKIAAPAIFRNPFAGKSFEEDLSPLSAPSGGLGGLAASDIAGTDGLAR